MSLKTERSEFQVGGHKGQVKDAEIRDCGGERWGCLWECVAGVAWRKERSSLAVRADFPRGHLERPKVMAGPAGMREAESDANVLPTTFHSTTPPHP